MSNNPVKYEYEINKGYSYRITFSMDCRVATSEVNAIAARIVSDIAMLGDLLERKESE